MSAPPEEAPEAELADVADRLKSILSKVWFVKKPTSWWKPVLEDAVAEIARLRARIQELEKALKPFANIDTDLLPRHWDAARRAYNKSELAEAKAQTEKLAWLLTGGGSAAYYGELAEAKGVIANLNERSAQYEREAETLRKERDFYLDKGLRQDNEIARLLAAVETLRKRVGELEELEADALQCASVEADLRREFRARAEQAEAQLAEERKANAANIAYAKDLGVQLAEAKARIAVLEEDAIQAAFMNPRAERAEAERDAMREVLTQIERRTKNAINVQNPTTMDNFIKEIGAMARAALTPSPAGPTDITEIEEGFDAGEWNNLPAGREG